MNVLNGKSKSELLFEKSKKLMPGGVNWKHLDYGQKALFQCALSCARQE
jgi:glutamate-1-semialdehyde aminotransferase